MTGTAAAQAHTLRAAAGSPGNRLMIASSSKAENSASSPSPPSLGASIPADLRDATTGPGERNIHRLPTEIRHAPGKRPEQRILMIVLSSENLAMPE